MIVEVQFVNVKVEILKQEFDYSLEEVNHAKNNYSRPLASICGSKASNSEAVSFTGEKDCWRVSKFEDCT